MAAEKTFLSIDTLEDALLLLDGGRQFVLCSPFRDLASQILDKCVARSTKGKSALVTFSPMDDSSIQQSVRTVVNLSESTSVQKATQLCKTHLTKISNGTTIFVDLISALPAPFSEQTKQSELRKDLSKALSEKDLKIAWFVKRGVVGDEILSAWKDEVDFFFDLRRIGSLVVGQFLTGKGISDAEFFLPRSVSVLSQSVTMTLMKLAPTVSSASTESQPSHHSVDVFEKQYKQVFDSATEGIVLFELLGDYKEFNKRAKEALGYSDAEAPLLSLNDLVVETQRFGTLRSLMTLRKKGKLSFRIEVKRKSGRILHVELACSLLAKNTYVAICRDVTDQVTSEIEAARVSSEYANFLANLPYPYAIFINRKLAIRNASFNTLFPWTTNESPSVSDFFGKRNSDLLKQIGQMLEEHRSGSLINHYEVRVPAPERKSVTTEVSISVVQYGARQALYCSFVDVSERRAVLDKAEDIDKKFAALLDQSIDAISILQDQTFVLLNRRFAEMFGFNNAMELLGKDISTVVAGRNGKLEILDHCTSVIAGDDGSTTLFEYNGAKKDGGKITVQMHSSRIVLDGKPALLSYHRDITSQKSAEADYKRKIEALSTLNKFADEIGDASIGEEIYRRGLHAAMKGSGFEVGAMFIVNTRSKELRMHEQRGLGEAVIAKLAVQKMDEGLARFFSKTHDLVVVHIADYPAYLPYKSLFEAESYTCVAFLPLVANGTLHGVLLLATGKSRSLEDNDRAMLSSLARHLSIGIEKSLLSVTARDAESRLESTVQNISDVIYTLQPNGSFEYISPNIETLIGYEPADFSINANLWRTLLHPDDRPIISQRVSNQALALGSFTLEYRLLPKGKASYIWLRDKIEYKRTSDGELSSISGIVSDITARKELEQLTAAKPVLTSTSSNEVLHYLAEGVAVFDNKGTCIEWNTALEHKTGIAAADVIGKNYSGFPESLQPLMEVVNSVIDSGDPAHATFSMSVPHSEKQQEVTINASPWRDASGSLLRVIASVTEVSGVDRLQQEVTESEQLLRNVVDGMGDALIISDLQGQIWEVNKEFTRLTGYERSEARLSTFPYPWLLDEEMIRFIRWIADLEDKKHLHDLDMTWRHKDGHHVAVSVNTTVLENALGQPMAILNVARDISERRRLSTELEWKNKQIELLNRIINFANTTFDIGQIFTAIATEIHNLVPNDGVSVLFVDHDGQLTRVYDGVPSEDGESLKVDSIELNYQVVQEAIASKRYSTKSNAGNSGELVQSQVSIPLFVSDALVGIFSITSIREHAFAEDELTFLQAIADQISATIQRVRLFEQVTDDSTYIHNLLNSINSVVYTVDANFRVTEVNNAWHDFMTRQGRYELANEDQIIGQPLDVILGDENLSTHYHRVMQDLFARRIDYYSRDFEIEVGNDRAAYRLDISPMVINNKVTALVFIHTDITDINRTEAEVKRRNRELVALNAIGTSISKSLELDEILRVATEQLRETFDANVVAFYLFDEDKNRLVLSRTIGVTDALMDANRYFDPASSLVGDVITHRKPHYVDDASKVESTASNIPFPLGLNSYAIVPLQSKEKIPGAFIISFAQPHGFSENDRQLLLLISNQLSAAIENAQLYAQIQRQVKTLTVLYELGKGLTGAVDLNSMLKVVYREVANAIPLDRFYYQSYLPEHNTLSLLSRTINGTPEFYPTGMKVRSLQDWPNRIYQEVVAKGTSFMGSSSASINDSIIAVPIKSDDKVLGIISIASENANRYNAVHLRLLESIANFTGVAIGKSTLYEDTLKKSIEIENRNKELDDFTYVVSHDLKEPLISIEGYSKIVIKDYKDKLDDEGREYLGSVIQSTNRMKHLIEDLLTLSRLGRMNEAQEAVSVSKVIEEILHDFQFTLKEKRVVVKVSEHMPSVQYSNTRLSMVFRNLISNAMKFNDKPNPTIAVDVRDEENEFVFSVMDNGIGIEPQYFERIFTIFQRLKRSEEYRGTGAGLTIAKKIVEREGGRIWVDSVPGDGSTFYFTIRKP
jgi:PAS domain S-box-containing protein